MFCVIGGFVTVMYACEAKDRHSERAPRRLQSGEWDDVPAAAGATRAHVTCSAQCGSGSRFWIRFESAKAVSLTYTVFALQKLQGASSRSVYMYTKHVFCADRSRSRPFSLSLSLT